MDFRETQKCPLSKPTLITHSIWCPRIAIDYDRVNGMTIYSIIPRLLLDQISMNALSSQVVAAVHLSYREWTIIVRNCSIEKSARESRDDRSMNHSHTFSAVPGVSSLIK